VIGTAKQNGVLIVLRVNLSFVWEISGAKKMNKLDDLYKDLTFSDAVGILKNYHNELCKNAKKITAIRCVRRLTTKELWKLTDITMTIAALRKVLRWHESEGT
jgi:hypothetical protein